MYNSRLTVICDDDLMLTFANYVLCIRAACSNQSDFSEHQTDKKRCHQTIITHLLVYQSRNHLTNLWPLSAIAFINTSRMLADYQALHVSGHDCLLLQELVEDVAVVTSFRHLDLS